MTVNRCHYCGIDYESFVPVTSLIIPKVLAKNIIEKGVLINDSFHKTN